MLTPEIIIARLEALYKEHAVVACLKPQGTDGFAYGLASGRVKGLVLAVEAIQEMLNEHERANALKESKL